MNWLERINEAVEYIETHLEAVDMAQVATISACTVYNFQRIFSYITDMSVAEYIRKRRMTRAAFDLQHTRLRIIDIALRYGYESDTSFARAFKNFHGISPSQTGETDIVLKAFPRLSFQLSIKGADIMNYRIEQKEGFQFFGLGRTFTTENNENLADIPGFWREVIQDGRFDQLKNCAGTYDNPELGEVNALCGYGRDVTDPKTFQYMIGCFVNKDSQVDAYDVVDVPASKWAIFRTETHVPSETTDYIQSLNRRIYTDWLPNSGYDIISGYEMELYYFTPEGKTYCESWIRVK